MTQFRFSWDSAKAKLNQAKHRVSFEEAQTIFFDDNATFEHDPDHSQDGDRQGDEKRTETVRGFIAMRKEYDFSKSKKNPYSRMLKKQITIRIEASTIDYFKKLAADSGIPYQNLINMYLRECAHTRKKPALQWTSKLAAI